MPATYEPIATTTLVSDQANITFSSLGTYTDLRLILQIVATNAGAETDFRFNGDSSLLYGQTELYGNGSSANANQNSTRSELYATNVSGLSSSNPALIIADIFRYRSSSFKGVLFRYAGMNGYWNGSVITSGGWRSTAAITSITIFTGFGQVKAGTTATLYGITEA